MDEVSLIDLSAIMLKSASHLVREGVLKGRLVIHRIVLMDIEKQASEGDTLAISGLEELEEVCRSRGVEIIYGGRLGDDVENIRLSINYEAKKLNENLVTCDPTTAKLAESIGVRVVYELPPPPFKIDDLFSEDIMSV
ncbi:MAG: hypothetical protein QXF08_06450, partial [Nitrososphaerota archaeon]